MLKYKLTDQKMQTHAGFQWELGIEYSIDIPGEELCSNAVFHFYDSPELAVLFNPVHAAIEQPRLFEAQCFVIVAHDGLKGGCKKMKLLHEIPLPQFTITQTVAFGILCARAVTKNPRWEKWADNWLDGKDRSKEEAWAAWAAAWAAAAAAAAARTAEAAEAAAKAAAWAAAAAEAAARTAEAAAWAAAAAEAAAWAAQATRIQIDFVSIANQTLKY